MTEQYAELRGRLVVGRKSDGRGVYDESAKRELIVACLKQGVSVARMAMEHGVNTNLLRTWIAAYQRRSAQVSAGDIARTQDAAFVAVHVEGEQDPPQRERAVAVPAVAHTPATAVAVIPDESPLATPTPMVGLQVRLPNGVQLDLGETSLQELPTLVQMLSRLPCSASTKG
ncbi:transposase [Variovorax sp. UC74_104]|uniref:transposase n=1 Tax=Variovorax sp. UC74_104 TaxID=3374555 RepID=UPI003757B142